MNSPITTTTKRSASEEYELNKKCIKKEIEDLEFICTSGQKFVMENENALDGEQFKLENAVWYDPNYNYETKQEILKTQGQVFFESDTAVTFDPIMHRYFVNGQPVTRSVTAILPGLFKEDGFDPCEVSKRYFKNSYIEPMQKLIEWEYASLFGSMVHFFIENLIKYIICDENNCLHKCQSRQYNVELYSKLFPSNKPPKFPCRFYRARIDEYLDRVREDFERFFESDHRFHLDTPYHVERLAKMVVKVYDYDEKVR